MEPIGLVLLGAALSFAATLLIERWKLIHASRTAAMMVLRELEFHNQRLALAAMLDQNEQATYELRFPSTVWSAHGSALLAGAPPQEAQAILNWYASMAVLGYILSRQVGPDGPHITGPERVRLQKALTDARGATRRLAIRWSLRKSVQLSPSLFDEVAR